MRSADDDSTDARSSGQPSPVRGQNAPCALDRSQTGGWALLQRAAAKASVRRRLTRSLGIPACPLSEGAAVPATGIRRQKGRGQFALALAQGHLTLENAHGESANGHIILRGAERSRLHRARSAGINTGQREPVESATKIPPKPAQAEAAKVKWCGKESAPAGTATGQLCKPRARQMGGDGACRSQVGYLSGDAHLGMTAAARRQTEPGFISGSAIVCGRGDVGWPLNQVVQAIANAGFGGLDGFARRRTQRGRMASARLAGDLHHMLAPIIAFASRATSRCRSQASPACSRHANTACVSAGLPRRVAYCPRCPASYRKLSRRGT